LREPKISWAELRRHIRVAAILAVVDLRNSYRRTSLGPIWGTVTSGVLIVTLWSVFGNLFPDSSYFSYLALGILLWSLVSGPLAASSTIFSGNENLIRSTDLPLWTYFLRMILKYLLVFAHSFLIVPFVVIFSGGEIALSALWFLLSLPLVVLNVFWISSLLAFLSTRFRDFAQIVNNVTVVLFYLTPVFWKPDILHPTSRESFLAWNPFYYLINLLREPWLGHAPRNEDWVAGLLMGILGMAVLILVYRSFKHRVIFWL
jgi:lipopolysaccharide transport system permease protein